MGLAIAAHLVTCSIAVLAGTAIYLLCRWLGRDEIGFRGGVLTSLVWFTALGPFILHGALWLTISPEGSLSRDKVDAVPRSGLGTYSSPRERLPADGKRISAFTPASP